MRQSDRLSSLCRSGVTGIAVWSLALVATSQAGSTTAPPPSQLARPPIVRDADLQHPIQVQVEALDPIRRGADVRFRVTSQSRVPLTGTRANLVSAGGATVVGRRAASLGRLSPGRPASTEFAVNVPAQGHRFLVEFRVEGEGPAGRISRGAQFNLLPDGPAEHPRLVVGANGQAIAEVPARRIP
jgi:hypothetical protein